MKPRLYKLGGVWLCDGRLFFGIGTTPRAAYDDWRYHPGRSLFARR